MKAHCFFLAFLGCALAGCGSAGEEGSTLVWGLASYPVTGYETIKEGLMKHCFAAPGTPYPEFEAAIEKIERVSSLAAEFGASPHFTTDHSYLFKYEGRTAIYYGRFVERTNAPSATYPTFAAGEIANLPSFVAKLKTPADPVSAFLISRFSESDRLAIVGFLEPQRNEKQLEAMLIEELNAIVLGPSIYEEDRFRDVTLSQTTRRFREYNLNHPQAMQTTRQQLRIVFNRLLLADAYPSNLPMKRWLPRQDYVAIKY